MRSVSAPPTTIIADCLSTSPSFQNRPDSTHNGRNATNTNVPQIASITLPTESSVLKVPQNRRAHVIRLRRVVANPLLLLFPIVAAQARDGFLRHNTHVQI